MGAGAGSVRILIALSLVVLVVVCVTGVIYLINGGRNGMTGDAHVYDAGVWTYPRYTVTFPQVPLSNGVYRKFSVTNLPARSMTFGLRLVVADWASPSSQGVLTEDWKVTVRIREDDESEMFEVSAPLSEWRFAQSTTDTTMWHMSLRDLPLRRNRQYAMILAVSGPADDVGGVFLEPRLTGGGNELP